MNTEAINTWWSGRTEERYWLGVMDRGSRSDLLAAPRADARHSSLWSHRLLTHVKDGDIVFHYHSGDRAIVACSTARGPVHERHLRWPAQGETPEPANAERGTARPSWAIELDEPVHLSPGVPLAEIARVQWELFPALRDLEDEVGEPLYYPFEMGNRFGTRPLPGCVFKLPALVVGSIGALANAAGNLSEPATTLRIHASAPQRAPLSVVGALLRLAK